MAIKKNDPHELGVLTIKKKKGWAGSTAQLNANCVLIYRSSPEFSAPTLLALNTPVDLAKRSSGFCQIFRLIGIAHLYVHLHDSVESAARLQTVESKRRPLSIKFHESRTRGGFRGRR